MHLADFDYHLPPHLIAREPCPHRDRSRLLVLRREPFELAHRRFDELPDFLSPGDLLVLNDTRVLPARLLGTRAATGGKWEGLFLRVSTGGTWEVLGQTRGTLTEGEDVLVEGPAGSAPLTLRLEEKTEAGTWRARPVMPTGEEAIPDVPALLERYGHVPLPPYILKQRAGREPAGEGTDRERYQTVYARQPGAVAAPTAGLHFTPALFEKLRERGVGRAFVTLHVGPGTFRPVKAEQVERHRMDAEWAELPADTAKRINACKERGGVVVAVGTTSVRVLETVGSLHAPHSTLHAFQGWTDLTIVPPFRFRVVDALVTNFHLPRSSLLLLVAAFAGLKKVRDAYAVAVEQGYRFYSYGDAMLIL
jgi:S-adenosylmethionine:tRNA ribosyltransferase-isomerase